MEAMNLLRNVGNNLQAHMTSYSRRVFINAAENLQSGVLYFLKEGKYGNKALI